MKMKKVEVVIRKSKFSEVKDALNQVGVEFITFWDVRGVGNRPKGVFTGVLYMIQVQ